MRSGRIRIGVVAPASSMEPGIARRVEDLIAGLYPDGRVEIVFHPQCFERWGHFAGTDESRARAFREIADDESFNAVWFGRGGYGSCRMALLALSELSAVAMAKTYLGYSDMGSLLGGLYRHGVRRLAHGPMPADIIREGGAVAVARALAFLVDEDPAAVEPAVLGRDVPFAAFNATILSHLLGTPLQPDLSNHVLMLEEVSEHMYRLDRDLFHITSTPAIRAVAGIMLGRCSDIPPNDPDFGQTEEEVARHWCATSGIAYLGRADIGHDIHNKVVPFGKWPWITP